MFKMPKALKEINKIQEMIYKEEKNLSSNDRVIKIRQEVDALRRRHGLRNKQTARSIN